MVVNELENFDKKLQPKILINFKSKVAPELASTIPHSLISFEHFLQGDYLSLEEKLITNDELNEALQTIKTKKSSGYGDI